MIIRELLASAMALCLVAAPLAAQEGAAGQDVRKFTNVTVHLKEAPPADVFKATGDAAGVQFLPPGNWGAGNQVRLNFDLKNQPFWFGALQAAGFYGYSFEPASTSPSDRRVRVVLTKSVHAQKMLLAPPLVVRVEVSRSQPKSIDLVAYSDPALHDWVFAGPPEITELSDGSGESLLPEETKPQLPPSPGLISRHPIQLSRVTREITSIKGSFVLLIAEAVDDWSISNPVAAPAQEHKIGKSTYSFTSLRKAGRQYELKLHVKTPADGGFLAGASDLTVGPGSILATDSSGRPWRITDIKGGYQAREATGIGEYNYTLTLAPEKGAPAGEITAFRWRIPTRMENVEIPIHFGDVALK